MIDIHIIYITNPPAYASCNSFPVKGKVYLLNKFVYFFKYSSNDKITTFQC